MEHRIDRATTPDDASRVLNGDVGTTPSASAIPWSAYDPDMQPIPLATILPADVDPTSCKLHCAVFNGEKHPIDVLANDPEEWQGWNWWRAGTNDFNR